MLRTKILNFLQWNDRNGCFTDENCKIEGYEPLTLEEAKKFFAAAICELDEWFEVDIEEEIKKSEVLKKALEIITNEDDSITTYKKIIDIL